MHNARIGCNVYVAVALPRENEAPTILSFDNTFRSVIFQIQYLLFFDNFAGQDYTGVYTGVYIIFYV